MATGSRPSGRIVEGMDVVDRLYKGYGESSGGGMRAGHQDKLFEEGNAYLDREFPAVGPAHSSQYRKSLGHSSCITSGEGPEV